MKYQLLFQRIQAPEGEESGSAGKGNAIKIEQGGQQDDDGDDSGDSANNRAPSSRDLDVFNAYHKLDKGGNGRTSTLNKFAQEAEEKQEEEDSGQSEKKASKPDASKEKAPSKDGSNKEEKTLTDDELLAIEEDKLVNAQGRPVSAATSQTIKQFKESLTKKAKAIAELEDKLKNAGTQLTEDSPEIKAIKEENAQLKKRIDDEYFEKSEAFTQVFVAPVKNAERKLEEYFTHLTEGEDAAKEVNALFAKAAKAAKTGNRVEFARILDEIAEDHVPGGTAMKSVFGSDMLEWFKLKQEEEKAYANKDENRKKIVARALADQRKSNVLSIDRDMEDHVTQFELSKKPVLDGLQGQQKEDYVKLYKDRYNAVTESIGEFTVSGKINQDLTAVINDGIIAPALKHELDLAWAGFKDLNNKTKIQEKEIAELKDKLAKVSREPSERRSGSYVQSTPAKSGEKPKSRIFAALSQQD